MCSATSRATVRKTKTNNNTYPRIFYKAKHKKLLNMGNFHFEMFAFRTLIITKTPRIK